MLTKFSSAAALIVTALPLIAGCVSGGGYKPVSEHLPALEVSFAEPAWNGNTIPAGQHCQMFGGKGQTPALKVGKIPAGANAIIVEFNDLSFGPLSSGGGHGKIGYWLKGAGSAVLSSVPGETADLGVEGSFIEARALSTGQYASPGYLPPCSGGRGHTYVADVKAVYRATKQGEESRLLAVQRIKLGTY